MAGAALLIVTANDADADVPHVFVAVTETFPEVDPNVIVALVVPCPPVTVAPAGTVQVYEVAPATAAIEYTFPVELGQAVAEPVIVPGVAGAALNVMAFTLAVDVPHVFVAVTVTLPEVDPNVTVALVVP